MKVDRLEELRKEAAGSCFCYDCIEFGPSPDCHWKASRIELVNADLYRTANAQTNDTHVATCTRLSKKIRELEDRINELEEDV